MQCSRDGIKQKEVVMPRLQATSKSECCSKLLAVDDGSNNDKACL